MPQWPTQNAPPAAHRRERLPLRCLLLAGLLFGALVGGTVAVHKLVQFRAVVALQAMTAADSLVIAQHLQTRIDEQIRQLHKIKEAWVKGGMRFTPDVIAAAKMLQEDYPAYRMIAGLGPGGICQWVVPPQDNQLPPRANFSEDRTWSAGLLQAKQAGRQVAAGWMAESGKGPGLLIVVPLFASDGDGSGAPMLVARLGFDEVIGEVIDQHHRRNFNVRLRDGDQVVFQAGQHPLSEDPCIARQLVRVADRLWQLCLSPTPELMAGRSGTWVLWVGIGLSFLTATGVLQSQAYRHREAIHIRRHLAALEALNHISIAISAKRDSGPEVLHQLAESARQLLGMSKSGAVLLDEQAHRLDLRGSAGDMPAGCRTTFPLADMPLCRRCLETGEVFFVEDVQREVPHPINLNITAEFGAACFIVIPLQVENRSIGLLALADGRPRRFTDSDRRLARLLASQAAVILANARLHEQTRATLEVQKQLLEQQDKLYAINAAVYHAATFEQSLQAVADRAPEALGVDMCTLGLLSEKGDVMIAVAGSGRLTSALAGTHYPMANTNTERALRQRQIVVTEDAATDPSVNPYYREALHIGSLIYAPLYRSDGSPLGMIYLIRHAPGSFSEAQLKLCQVFSDRAAAAIENAQLQAQTRRDARTQAMLLRELHHRVKNNLAGIVALLSMNEPTLPSEARQWLKRVSERIQTMARAHDLFSGGVDRVGLRQLVDQALATLSVIKPPGVVVRVQIPHDDLKLTTPRAVSLAMVLHELCSNAIQHGLSERGTLTIQSRCTPLGLAVDVIDDGGGPPFEAEAAIQEASGAQGPPGRTTAAPRQGGMGLELVCELVGRELHGSFRLAARRGGGTIATIEFPLGDHDREGALS